MTRVCFLQSLNLVSWQAHQVCWEEGKILSKKRLELLSDLLKDNKALKIFTHIQLDIVLTTLY